MPLATLGFNPGGTCFHPASAPQHPQAPSYHPLPRRPNTRAFGPISPSYHSQGPPRTLPSPTFIGETEAGGGCFVLFPVAVTGAARHCSSCLQLNGAPWGELGGPPDAVAVLGRQIHKNSSILLSHSPLFWEVGPLFWLPGTQPGCLSWPRPAPSCWCPCEAAGPPATSLGTRWGVEHVLHWPHVVPF